jgi:phage tail-like protein
MRRYLNDADNWTSFKRLGLEIDPETGALILRRLPGRPHILGRLPDSAGKGGHSGAAGGTRGEVYVADPWGNQVWRFDACDPSVRPVLCRPGGESWAIGPVLAPRAVLYDCLGRLLVADTGNHRVQVLDSATGRPLDVWGQPFRHDPPSPRHERGWLTLPNDLAQDRAGNVYVVTGVLSNQNDPDPKLVRKFSLEGIEDVAFSKNFPPSLRDGGPGREFEPHFVRVVLWTLAGEQTPRERLAVLALRRVPRPTAGQGSWRGEVSLYETDGSPARVPPLPLAAPTESAMAYISQPGGFAVHQGRAFVLDRGAEAAGALPGQTAGPDQLWCYKAEAAFRSGGTDEERVAASEPVVVSIPVLGDRLAGLGVRGEGGNAELLTVTGPGLPVFALGVQAGHRTRGAFLAGPFVGNQGQPTAWQRLRVLADDLPAKTQVQFFSLSATARTGPLTLPVDLLPSWYPAADARWLSALGLTLTTLPPRPESADVTVEPLAEASKRRRAIGRELGLAEPGQWHPAPPDQVDFLTRNSPGDRDEPADRLWMLGLVGGTGEATPYLRQVRLDHDDDGWLGLLPEHFQRDPAGRDFLRRLLALLEAEFEETTETIDGLPALAVPASVQDRYGGARPKAAGPELNWLAGWLGLPSRQDSASLLRLFHDGPALFGRRGTPAGLRRLILLLTGLRVEIVEPGVEAALFAAGGPDTGARLAAAGPDGAMLGAAVLGQARLAPAGPSGPPLFADVAYRFVVRVVQDDLEPPARRAALEAVLDRFAPAHCLWSIKTIPAGFVLGPEARMGGMTLGAGPPPYFRLDDRNALGLNTTLPPGPPQPPCC